MSTSLTLRISSRSCEGGGYIHVAVDVKYFVRYLSLFITSRSMKWAGHVEHVGEKKNACRFLVGEPIGNRSLGRPRCKWDGNVKMDQKEVR